MTTLRNLKKYKKILILDCDGVLTNGRTYYSSEGRILKVFNSSDSYAIKNFKNKSMNIIVLTSDLLGFNIVKARARDWGIEAYCEDDKLSFIKDIKEKNPKAEIYFVGNGPEDIVIFNQVNTFFAPKDSRKEVLEKNGSDSFVLIDKNGGEGVLDDVYDYLYSDG
ncbi:MAG TPA: hypothetical protein ENI23_04475 [bacterium]|nr:hypothetical protein [bacterium]